MGIKKTKFKIIPNNTDGNFDIKIPLKTDDVFYENNTIVGKISESSDPDLSETININEDSETVLDYSVTSSSLVTDEGGAAINVSLDVENVVGNPPSRAISIQSSSDIDIPSELILSSLSNSFDISAEDDIFSESEESHSVTMTEDGGRFNVDSAGYGDDQGVIDITVQDNDTPSYSVSSVTTSNNDGSTVNEDGGTVTFSISSNVRKLVDPVPFNVSSSSGTDNVGSVEGLSGTVVTWDSANESGTFIPSSSDGTAYIKVTLKTDDVYHDSNILNFSSSQDNLSENVNILEEGTVINYNVTPLSTNEGVQKNFTFSASNVASFDSRTITLSTNSDKILFHISGFSWGSSKSFGLSSATQSKWILIEPVDPNDDISDYDVVGTITVTDSQGSNFTINGVNSNSFDFTVLEDDVASYSISSDVDTVDEDGGEVRFDIASNIRDGRDVPFSLIPSNGADNIAGFYETDFISTFDNDVDGTNVVSPISLYQYANASYGHEILNGDGTIFIDIDNTIPLTDTAYKRTSSVSIRKYFDVPSNHAIIRINIPEISGDFIDNYLSYIGVQVRSHTHYQLPYHNHSVWDENYEVNGVVKGKWPNIHPNGDGTYSGYIELEYDSLNPADDTYYVQIGLAMWEWTDNSGDRITNDHSVRLTISSVENRFGTLNSSTSGTFVPSTIDGSAELLVKMKSDNEFEESASFDLSISQDSKSIDITGENSTINYDITASPLTISEGSSAITVDISASNVLNFSSDRTLAVSHSTNGLDDITLSTQTVTIPAGQTSGSFTITPVDDSNIEVDETITLTITDSESSNFTVNGVAGNSFQLNLLDNDDVASYSVSSDVDTVDEDGGTVRFTISSNVEDGRSVPFSILESVGVGNIASVTAVGSSTITYNGDGTGEFTPHQSNGVCVIDVTLKSDDVYYNNNSFTFSIPGESEIVDINEDSNTELKYSISTNFLQSYDEGSSITVTVDVDNAVGGVPSRNILLSTDREDDINIPSQLSLVGVSQNFQIDIVDDSSIENVETCTVSLADNLGSFYNSASELYEEDTINLSPFNIIDNDVNASYSIDSITTSNNDGISVNEDGGSVTFTITSNVLDGREVEFTISENTDAATGLIADNILSIEGDVNQSKTHFLPDSQTGEASITITMKKDSVYWPSNNFTFSVPGDSETISIVENTPKSYIITPSSISDSEGSGNFSINVSSNSHVGADVLPDISVSFDSQYQNDITLSSNVLDMSSGSDTLNVSILEDSSIEIDESFSIQFNDGDSNSKFSLSGIVQVGTASLPITIYDNESSTPSYQVSPSSTSVDEDSGEITLSIDSNVQDGREVPFTISENTDSPTGLSADNIDNVEGINGTSANWNPPTKTGTFTPSTSDGSAELKITTKSDTVKWDNNNFNFEIDNTPNNLSFDINEDPTVPVEYSITPSSSSVTEGSSEEGSVTFGVEITNVVGDLQQTVDFSIDENSTTTQTADNVQSVSGDSSVSLNPDGKSGSINLSNGVTSEVTVLTKNDDVYWPGNELGLSIGDSEYQTSTSNSVEVVNTDIASYTLTSDVVTVNENGGVVVFTVDSNNADDEYVDFEIIQNVDTPSSNVADNIQSIAGSGIILNNDGVSGRVKTNLPVTVTLKSDNIIWEGNHFNFKVSDTGKQFSTDGTNYQSDFIQKQIDIQEYDSILNIEVDTAHLIGSTDPALSEGTNFDLSFRTSNLVSSDSNDNVNILLSEYSDELSQSQETFYISNSDIVAGETTDLDLDKIVDTSQSDVQVLLNGILLPNFSYLVSTAGNVSTVKVINSGLLDDGDVVEVIYDHLVYAGRVSFSSDNFNLSMGSYSENAVTVTVADDAEIYSTSDIVKILISDDNSNGVNFSIDQQPQNSTQGTNNAEVDIKIQDNDTPNYWISDDKFHLGQRYIDENSGTITYNITSNVRDNREVKFRLYKQYNSIHETDNFTSVSGSATSYSKISQSYYEGWVQLDSSGSASLTFTSQLDGIVWEDADYRFMLLESGSAFVDNRAGELSQTTYNESNSSIQFYVINRDSIDVTVNTHGTSSGQIVEDQNGGSEFYFRIQYPNLAKVGPSELKTLRLYSNTYQNGFVGISTTTLTSNETLELSVPAGSSSNSGYIKQDIYIGTKYDSEDYKGYFKNNYYDALLIEKRVDSSESFNLVVESQHNSSGDSRVNQNSSSYLGHYNYQFINTVSVNHIVDYTYIDEYSDYWGNSSPASWNQQGDGYSAPSQTLSSYLSTYPSTGQALSTNGEVFVRIGVYSNHFGGVDSLASFGVNSSISDSFSLTDSQYVKNIYGGAAGDYYYSNDTVSVPSWFADTSDEAVLYSDKFHGDDSSRNYRGSSSTISNPSDGTVYSYSLLGRYGISGSSVIRRPRFFMYGHQASLIVQTDTDDVVDDMRNLIKFNFSGGNWKMEESSSYSSNLQTQIPFIDTSRMKIEITPGSGVSSPWKYSTFTSENEFSELSGYTRIAGEISSLGGSETMTWHFRANELDSFDRKYRINIGYFATTGDDLQDLVAQGHVSFTGSSGTVSNDAVYWTSGIKNGPSVSSTGYVSFRINSLPSYITEFNATIYMILTDVTENKHYEKEYNNLNTLNYSDSIYSPLPNVKYDVYAYASASNAFSSANYAYTKDEWERLAIPIHLTWTY